MTMTPGVASRSSEIVDQLLELIARRIAAAPEAALQTEMISLAIGLHAWASVIEESLPEPAKSYARRIGAQLAQTIEAPKT